MKETQESVGKWADETFSGNDPASPRRLLRALEEMVELCLAGGATAEDIEYTVGIASLSARRDKGVLVQNYITSCPLPNKIPKEAADVVIVLYTVAHSLGFDIHEHIDEKMAVNRSRKWVAQGDGTGYHVKPNQ